MTKHTKKRLLETTFTILFFCDKEPITGPVSWAKRMWVLHIKNCEVCSKSGKLNNIKTVDRTINVRDGNLEFEECFNDILQQHRILKVKNGL